MEKEKITKLVNRAQDGDPHAMEELLELAHTSVSYQCRKMMAQQEDAEDLTQEILLIVYQKLDTLQEPAAFQGWLNRITATRCMNALSRTHVDLQFAEDEEGNSILDNLESLDERQIPDKAIDNAETVRMISEIVSGLPEAQRMSTLLYYYDEMSVKEIAQIMGVPENTVKSRLNLARKAIKEKVLDYEKQGVKLYSISILPFLWYFLRTAAKMEANTGAATACVASVMANTTAAAATASTATTGAVVTGATTTGTVTTGIVAKIVAACLAVAVTIGGTAIYLNRQNSTDTKVESETETNEHAASNLSLDDQAMEAYDAILRQGQTDRDLQVYYYTYIDLDHNGVNELIVANNKGTEDAWTNCEIYTYDSTGLKFCTEIAARYSNLYYVNNEYILSTNTSHYYYSLSHTIEVVSYYWDEEGIRNDPAISFDGGEWQYITYAEYSYYAARYEGFAETREIVVFEENPYNRFDIGITDLEVLQLFYDAKEFYDEHIYGKRFLDSRYHSASGIDWIDGVIEYRGGLYAPCDEYTYDEFVQKLQSLFTSDVVEALIEEVGLIEYNEKCYTYVREGAGDPILGNYSASAHPQGNVIFEIRISFTALDGSSVTEHMYCQQEEGAWVLDGSYFYGE